MPALPVVSRRKAVPACEKLGCPMLVNVAVKSVKDGETVTLSIPDHKEIAKGTLRSLIRAAGITPDEFVRLV